MVSQSLPIVSKCNISPLQKSAMADLKLSVSDLPMLSINYIQKGLLFKYPKISIAELIDQLKLSLAHTLTHFPPLAGRMKTDENGYIYITCNDAGADFIQANGTHLRIEDLMGSVNSDVPESVRGFFPFDGMVSYEGHFRPILAVQVTELADGVFIGFAVNHAVTDGTSLWNFINTFAEVNSGVKRISRAPDFSRDSVLISAAVIRIPAGGLKLTFSGDAPVRERIFRFTRESILKLKARVNDDGDELKRGDNGVIDVPELMGKRGNDTLRFPNGKITPLTRRREMTRTKPTVEISSFQSLSALLWRAVTRARKLPSAKTTTFRMAVNCRHRLEPNLHPLYFGNALQSITTIASADNLMTRNLRWCAEELNRTVAAHDYTRVREYVENWERDPHTFPLGNFDGAMIMMGSSPRFPMYDNDFGWGRPLAVRSGRANKFDGKISAFPGREGGGSVDLEVILSPETMAGLEADSEFMHYVSIY